MEYSEFFEEYGMPYTGRKKDRLIKFLSEQGLTYDEQIESTVNLVNQDGEIAATCSLHGNVLKDIAVEDKYQGYGLSARVVTLMLNLAQENGETHLFLFTKSKNKQMFSDLGFFEIIETENILLMENKRDGIAKFIDSIKINNSGTIGAVVMNCNPFTNGHRYLVETAAKQCDFLYVFVLSEDKSEFPADVRFRLVKEGLSDLTNILVCQSSDYLISSAVFPTYFIKDKIKAKDANSELDVRIFCEKFAKKLNITKRFVGTEPFCEVTGSYNEKLKSILPLYGIELVEIERMQIDDEYVSASKVRRLLCEGDMEHIKRLVPESTYRYLCSEEYRNGK